MQTDRGFSTRGEGYAHQIKTGNPRFLDLPTALRCERISGCDVKLALQDFYSLYEGGTWRCTVKNEFGFGSEVTC